MSAAVSVTFTAEETRVIYHWIEDVCGDAMQILAHRQSQLAAWTQDLRQPPLNGGGGESLFRSFSRSGTREVVVLRNILSMLERLHVRDTAELEMIGREITSIEDVLRKNSFVVAEDPVALAYSATESSLSSASSPSGVCQSLGDVLPDMCDPAAAAADEIDSKHTQRCLDEIQWQMQEISASLEMCRGRCLYLQDQDKHQKKKLHDISETETSMMECLERANVALATERSELAQEYAAVERIQQLDVYAESLPDWHDAGAGENEDEADAACVLRASVADARRELVRVRAAMKSDEGAHAVRFRHTRQRLRDWQIMVGQMRRTRDQLYARTRMIGRIVENSALRLEAESELGYMKQLRKLNALLLERSTKIFGLHGEMPGGGNDGNSSGSVGAGSSAAGGSEDGAMRMLFAHGAHRTSSVSTADEFSSTPPGRGSSISSTATATVASSGVTSPFRSGSTRGVNSQQRQEVLFCRRRQQRQRHHRQVYALLTYLQQWETGLVAESNALVAACERGITSITSSSSRAVFLRELRNILSAGGGV